MNCFVCECYQLFLSPSHFAGKRMDNNKNNGRTNLKKYRTYKAAGPSTSTPSMASSGTQPPTTTTRQVAPVPQTPRLPVLEVISPKSKEKELRRKKRLSGPIPATTGRSPVVPQTRRNPIDPTMESLHGKHRPPAPVPTTSALPQPSQFRQTPVPVPQTPRTPILPTTELLPLNQHLAMPVRKTSAHTQPKQSGQSSTPSTNSRNNPFELPTYLRAPAPTALLRGDQSSASSPEQSSLQQILPLLTVIKDQQTTILSHNATSDRSLRDLVAKVGKLSEWAKQRDEGTKERETKDKANEEREKEKLKALILLAKKVDDVRKHVVGIETVVGVSKGNDRMTMLDRLQNIEMNIEEWLERARDPDAGD